uniref:Membrane spanning 4-domains A15 n=1 Tax=Monodelphis domestica TaxID=13616 RepID=F7G7A6_MONDO
MRSREGRGLAQASLATMTSAPATNGVFVVIPPNNASGIRPGPAMLPRTLCQSPGTLQFEETPLGAQPSGSVPHQRLPPAETFLNGEPKALGTVQILIGLIYISFGSVLLMFRRGYIGMLFIDGGIPFWGGVCFIISGSLSVATEKYHSSCLVSANTGCPQSGCVVLCLQDVGRGYLAVLTIFTILEFFIAVIATYFGCQATRSNPNARSMVFLPNAFSTDFNIPSPAATPPPAYDNVAYTSKETSE